MPLYSNILLSNEGEDGAEELPTGQVKTSQQLMPSASLKLLQAHLMSKKRTKQTTVQPNKMPRVVTDLPQSVSDSALRQHNKSYWTQEEEYDPMTPNSYELCQLEHIKAEEQRLAARRDGNRIDLSILDALDRMDAENDDASESKIRSSRGTAIAPPPMLHSATSDSTQHSLEPTKGVQTSQTSCDKLDGKSAAAKIMAKMGYKSGQGLGKDKQGMSAPLEVETVGGASVARIVQKQHIQPPSCLADTTRVMMLLNMVGPSEVDDDLEAETKEECSKYGEVVKCLIYEIPNKKVPDDEAVRIFVEFKSVASTKKAISDLNGRYFGGRVVKAIPYDEDKFNRYELAP